MFGFEFWLSCKWGDHGTVKLFKHVTTISGFSSLKEVDNSFSPVKDCCG